MPVPGVPEKIRPADRSNNGHAIRGQRAQPASVGNGSMVAFSARSWKAVDDFYAAALANGGVCDGAPGFGFITRRTFTPPTCAILTETRWRPSVVGLRRNRSRRHAENRGDITPIMLLLQR